MYPILFDFVNFQVRTFGVVIFITFVLVMLASRSTLARVGLSIDSFKCRLFWVVLSGFVFARLPVIFSGSSIDISSFFAFWDGNFNFFGGVAGVVLAFWFTRKNDDFIRLLDASAVPMAIAFVGATVARFFDGRYFYGMLTDSWFSMLIEHADFAFVGELVLPLPYLAMGVGVVAYFLAKRRFVRIGFNFYVTLLFISVASFALEFLRADSTVVSKAMPFLVAIAINFYFIFRKKDGVIA